MQCGAHQSEYSSTWFDIMNTHSDGFHLLDYIIMHSRIVCLPVVGFRINDFVFFFRAKSGWNEHLFHAIKFQNFPIETEMEHQHCATLHVYKPQNSRRFIFCCNQFVYFWKIAKKCLCLFFNLSHLILVYSLHCLLLYGCILSKISLGNGLNDNNTIVILKCILFIVTVNEIFNFAGAICSYYFSSTTFQETER